MTGPVSRGTVTMLTDRCKGRELCIPACQPGVLEMSTDRNTAGYRFPELSAGCTGCRACRDVCPDFVFEVFRYNEPVDETGGFHRLVVEGEPE